MYNAHWIHSLPYSKFIELTLFILPYVLHKIFIGKVNKTIAFACIVVYAMLMFTKTLYTPVPLGGKYEYQFIPYQY